ncbi:MAG: type II secretion system F family protein [Pseudomonadales bacterium]|nr:type II secretion system F family protein [Pseudomonadales bacterium]
MDYLLHLLSVYIEDEVVLQYLFVVLVALTAFAAAGSIIFLLTPLYNPMRYQLAKIASSGKADYDDYHDDKLFDISFLKYVESIGKYVLPKDMKERDSAKARLIHAGFRGEGSLRMFYAIKTILCIILTLLSFQLVKFFPEFTSIKVMMFIAAFAFAGLLLPNMVLSRLAEARIKKIRHGFPDALDLFVVCVEAGLGLDATIQRVAVDLKISHPELSDELDLVVAEMRIGIDRITALRELALRTGLDEIKGLVALLNQSVKFGTGIAETLRIYSDEFRDKRMQKAEEEAAKVATKMIFPLTLCMWPAFFVIAVGPAIIKVMNAFQ